MDFRQLLTQPVVLEYAEYGLNSEWDSFGNKQVSKEVAAAVEEIHEKLSIRYRNFNARDGKTPFRYTDLCVMPNTEYRDGVIYACPVIEFSANDNDFTGGEDHDGYDYDTLLDRLNGLFGEAPDCIKVGVIERPTHYLNVFLECEAVKLDELFAYIDEVDGRFKTEYSDLKNSHEYIC